MGMSWEGVDGGVARSRMHQIEMFAETGRKILYNVYSESGRIDSGIPASFTEVPRFLALGVGATT